MGLTVTLNNALTGLNVNQQQLSVLSQNIANANTPGYSKQVAQQNSVYLSGAGQGVSISSINRKVDEYLTKAVQVQSSVVANTEVVNDYSNRIQLLLGNPGNLNSMDAYVNTFYNSVQSLAQTPQNTTLQQTAVNNGITLASQISDLAGSLRDLQFQADQEISKAVTQVNVSLKRLSELNNLISDNVALGKNVAELQDQRDQTVQDIGQYINISTFVQASGKLSATTGNGIPILDNSAYQLLYTPAASATTFSDNTAIGEMTVIRIDRDGNQSSAPVILTTAGTAGNIASAFTSGKISGLMQMRDREIPAITAQLDTMSANLRDSFNAISNLGSGYPGANEFTSTRPVFSQQVNLWTGQARIAVLDSNGQPIASPYPNEPNGYAPLTLDLEKMNTGSGEGVPSVQGIIDAFNQYYGVPQNKAGISNLNNIQLISDSATIPASPPRFNFDFNLNNISGKSSSFYVTSVSVQNNNGTDITSVTNTIPRVDLDPTNTYVTSAGSNSVTINSATSSNLSNGQVVYLSTPPGGPYDGLPADALGGYFTISNVNGNSFQITVAGTAGAGATIGVAGQSATPAYSSAATGGDTRTKANGLFTADLSADASAPFYMVSVTVGVDDGSGQVQTSIITYRVNNQQPNALNKAIGAYSMQGSGELVPPSSARRLASAMLVDENGVELPKLNGVYTNEVPGYLKIIATGSSNNIAIDSMNSRELGDPTTTPATPGTTRGFSHYFDLNNFFLSNKTTTTGDTVKGSALNLAVGTRLKTNPGLLSLGQMIKSPDSLATGAAPNYTYQLNPGDNSVVTKLATLANAAIKFASSGGLGVTTQTFSGYAAQIIGSASTNAVTAKTNNTNANALLNGYNENASGISGVNLDTELANTVIYQNAYTASARVITVTNQLFETLLNTFT